MYKYEYERINSDTTGWGMFQGAMYEMEEYKLAINRRASAGWRYVGFLPAMQRATGHIAAMDLVFEREQDEK